jgi:general bacterial porin, GBP family
MELATMKRTMLAASVFASFFAAASAQAQSSVTLYGLIDAGITYTNNEAGHSNWQMLSSPTQNTVFGLKGTEDLGGGLKATFKLEQGFNLNNGAQAFSGDGFGSQAWVGLQHDSWGTLTFGRQYDAFNDTLGPLSAEFNTWGGSLAAHPFENDNLAADSVVVNNSVKYVTPNFHGLSGEAMYSFSNRAGGFNDNRSYSVGASYAQGPFTFAGGYLQFNNAGGGVSGTNPSGAVSLNDGSANFAAQRQRIWGAGASAAFGPATVGLVWSHTQLDNMASVLSLGLGSYLPLDGTLRLDNYEANVKYALTPAWSVSAAYTFTDGAYGNNTSIAYPSWNTVMLQTDYGLSKRTDVYVEGIYQHVRGAPPGSALGQAMINTQSPSSNGSQTSVTVGLRHAF